MEKCYLTQLYRLNRCIERLDEEYKQNVPDVIKKFELLLIKGICDELLDTLE